MACGGRGKGGLSVAHAFVLAYHRWDGVSLNVYVLLIDQDLLGSQPRDGHTSRLHARLDDRTIIS